MARHLPHHTNMRGNVEFNGANTKYVFGGVMCLVTKNDGLQECEAVCTTQKCAAMSNLTVQILNMSSAALCVLSQKTTGCENARQVYTTQKCAGQKENSANTTGDKAYKLQKNAAAGAEALECA